MRLQSVQFRDPDLRSRWQQEAGQRLQRGINWGTGIVAAVMVLSIIRDLILQWEGWEGLMAFRLFVIAPLILLPWIPSRTTIGSRHRADIVLVTLSALFLSMAVMFIWMPAIPGASKCLVSVLFLPIFAAATTLFPIGFRRTLVLSTTGVVAFVMAYSQIDDSLLRISLMSWTVFAVAGVLVGGSWRLERQERLLWEAKQRLEAEQASDLNLLQNVFPAPIANPFTQFRCTHRRSL